MACLSWRDTFASGRNRFFVDKSAEVKLPAIFERILADEHRQGQPHQDAWELAR